MKKTIILSILFLLFHPGYSEKTTVDVYKKYSQTMNTPCPKQYKLHTLKSIIMKHPDLFFPYLSFSGILATEYNANTLYDLHTLLSEHFSKDSFTYLFIMYLHCLNTNNTDQAQKIAESIDAIPYNPLILEKLMNTQPERINRFTALWPSEISGAHTLSVYQSLFSNEPSVIEEVFLKKQTTQEHSNTDLTVFWVFRYMSVVWKKTENPHHTLLPFIKFSTDKKLSHHHFYSVYLNALPAHFNKKIGDYYNALLLLLNAKVLAEKYYFTDFFFEYDFQIINMLWELKETESIKQFVYTSAEFYKQKGLYACLFNLYHEAALCYLKNKDTHTAFEFFSLAMSYSNFGSDRQKLANIEGYYVSGKHFFTQKEILSVIKQWQTALNESYAEFANIYFSFRLAEELLKRHNIEKAQRVFSMGEVRFIRSHEKIMHSNLLYARKTRRVLADIALKFNSEILFKSLLNSARSESLNDFDRMWYYYQLFMLTDQKKTHSWFLTLKKTVNSFLYIQQSQNILKGINLNSELEKISFDTDKVLIIEKTNQVKKCYTAELKKAITALSLIIVLLFIISILFIQGISIMKNIKSRLLGGYTLLEKIGEGGLGTVYKASPIKDSSSVYALKILKNQRHEQHEYKKRFIRECDILKSIHHTNIMKFIDFGEDNNQPFLVSEYIQGQSLDHFLENQWPLTPSQQKTIIYQMLNGIEYLHQKHIVHRDLKPSNIMICQSEKQLKTQSKVKIMDFGLARSHDSIKMTGTQEFMGTPLYIAPEVFFTGETGIPSDIYSTGIILYEIFCGTPPFQHKNPDVLIHQLLYENPLRPSEIYDKINCELDNIIMKCISKYPEERFCSVEELKSQLIAALEATNVPE